MTRKILAILTICFCLLFAGCHQSDSSPSSNEEYLLSGKIIYDPLSHADVTISDTSGLLASASTDEEGNFSLRVSEPPPYYIRSTNDQDSVNTTKTLEAWCESSTCFVSPWSTLIARLKEKHGLTQAIQSVRSITGYDSDPFRTLQEKDIETSRQLQHMFSDLLDSAELNQGTLSEIFGEIATETCSASFNTVFRLPSSCSSSSLSKGSSLDLQKGVSVKNAGLVLTSVFHSVLFNRIGMLSNNQFISRTAQEDAVYYLQYLASGTTEANEQELALNKVLVGIHPTSLIEASTEMSMNIHEILTQLLLSIINNWTSLNGTSIEGLRGSFLIREGLLREEDDSWVLVVERKSYDILLDQLPWNFSNIYHPWMDKPLIVKW